MKSLVLILFLLFYFGIFNAQTIEVHYFVIDTSKTKSDLKALADIYRNDKVFSKVNFTFQLISLKDVGDTTWVKTNKQRIDFFSNKIACDFNINNLLESNESLMLKLNSEGENYLICNKTTYSKLNNDISFNVTNMSLKSDMVLMEKLKQLVSEKRQKNMNIVIIQSEFDYLTPKFNFNKNSIECDGKTPVSVGYTTTSSYSRLNMGEGLSSEALQKMKVLSNKDEFILASYTDALGCDSNKDTINVKFIEPCACEKRYGVIGINDNYMGTMKLERPAPNPQIKFKRRISPQINGGWDYLLIVNAGCFDFLEVHIKSSDPSIIEMDVKFTFDRKSMRLQKSDGLEFDLELSKFTDFIKNPKVHAIVTITPYYNDQPCYDRSFTERIKFSPCSSKDEE